MARIALVSLGCPKNLVDSEGALGEIHQAGHEITTDQSRADVIVVNTCGFIESARQESYEAVAEAVQKKDDGNCRGVVVIGCLSQRYGRDIVRVQPGVDAVLGIDHAGKLSKAIESVLDGNAVVDVSAPPCEWVEDGARIQSTPQWTPYVKVADGCDNRCSYCAIPDIRGPFRSRPESAVVDESRQLADAGVRELILVGQDLTQYGADWGRANSLPALLEKLGEIESLRWIRLLYCYPTKVTRELIDVMVSSDKLVKYMDIPLQHGDDEVLRTMNRRGGGDEYLRLIEDLRSACPEIALRSSFIVGFPGETDAAFGRLLAFVERIQFDRVGVFAYSREQGTPAFDLPGRVPDDVAQSRRDALMRLQQRISLEKNRSFVGRRIEVLVEGRWDEGFFGRSYRDAPEIDGLVYVRSAEANLGDFVEATVTDAEEYDLVAMA